MGSATNVASAKVSNVMRVIVFSIPFFKIMKKGRGSVSGPAASECFGQPLKMWTGGLPIPVELNLSTDDLRQNGLAVLDAQTLDLSVPQVPAIADELTPRGR